MEKLNKVMILKQEILKIGIVRKQKFDVIIQFIKDWKTHNDNWTLGFVANEFPAGRNLLNEYKVLIKDFEIEYNEAKPKFDEIREILEDHKLKQSGFITDKDFLMDHNCRFIIKKECKVQCNSKNLTLQYDKQNYIDYSKGFKLGVAGI